MVVKSFISADICRFGFIYPRKQPFCLFRLFNRENLIRLAVGVCPKFSEILVKAKYNNTPAISSVIFRIHSYNIIRLRANGGNVRWLG